jgi:hypothetical protein
MRNGTTTRRALRRSGALLWLAAPALAFGAMSGQGIQPQGIQPQGIQPQGIQPQGIQPQGIQPQGIQPQGIQPQGIQPQGTQAAGVALLGTDLLAADLLGVEIGSVDLRGTTAASDLQPFELSSGPGISTGAGDYISVGGASAAGHYAVAHLVDAAGNPAEDLDLYIADERADPVPNLLHRGDEQANDDVTLYTVFAFNRSSGQWGSLCPFHAATGGATAMAIAEDPSRPSRFIFACTANGVDAKCARGWGFRPWRDEHAYLWDDASNDWVDQTFAGKPFYDACKIAARAAYCQDRQSFTREGTLVDLFDTRQLVWPNAIENPFGASPDSRWMFTQEYFVSVDPLATHPELKATALERTRYRDLSPVGLCADLAYVDRLELDHFEDGRWASPLQGTPRVEVFSPSYCPHNEHEAGAPLAWDCSPCTTSVCKTLPGCCRLDANAPGWDAVCVAAAEATCGDPPGLVWPRDLPPAAPAPRKLLLGPGGAVESVDAQGSNVVAVTGWACDPEWAGAAASVAVYGGAPREQAGSTLLGVAYADQPLATPLAREVSAACDGPSRASARHGFSLALRPGAPGPVFVYALDAATADGPAAPPTLLRNGIVDPGAPIGNGRPFAAVTTGWIEAPASGTYRFSSAIEPSRLWVNGQKLVDWWAGAGPTDGSIDLLAGGRYHLRWDRFEHDPPGQGPVAGLTWQAPGSAGLAAIPASSLYRVAPGSGQGLAATYFAGRGFAGSSVARLDPAVDLGAGPPATVAPPPGIAPPSFSVIWQGEIVPLYSDTYTFTVTAAGTADLSIAGQALLPPEVQAPALAPACPHDICALGDKLTASSSFSQACDPCVDQICAADPYCCNGGYLSYYSSEPVWDAKCVTEVGALCGLACQNPLPSSTTRKRAATPIALQAGVRYPIRLAVDGGTADVTTQLLWTSARQMREVVPTPALYGAGAPAEGGAGLNVVLFAASSTGSDLSTPFWSGPTSDLSISGGTADNPVGPAPVAVLAAPDDATAATPAPPAVVSPRSGAHDVEPAPKVSLTVVGGVRGGAVHARVQGTSIDVVLPFDDGGNLTGGAIPVGSYGPQTLVLSQLTSTGTESDPVTWSVVVDEQSPASPPPPVLMAPRDPTSSPDPTRNVFQVIGHGLPGPVEACDQGGVGQSGVLAQSLRAAADGTITGSVTLTAGTSVDPNPGWHKLSLSQDGCATTSQPAFISVGIRPPTVTFPRSGAPFDCSLGGVVGQLLARGTLPYAPATFGPLVVAEELGRSVLGPILTQVTVDPTPGPDGSFGFTALLPNGLPFGKHLLYFFQAPTPPAGATQADVDAFERDFASIAATPMSRIEIDVPPPPLALPVAGPLVTGAAPVLQALGCAQTLVPGCAQPLADVNVRDGQRVWTTRASASGDWQIALPDLTPGWHQLTLGQVVDSPVGGGWVESCASPALPLGLVTGGAAAPALSLPAGLVEDATSAAGAVLGYGAGATAASGGAVPVTCQPPSGSSFPIGASNVLCTAVDPATRAVAVGAFPVTVIDGPPIVNVPADITAEADSALGALVSYAVDATDAVSGPLPVTCTPSSPALFPVNEDVTVTCQATDGAHQTTTRSFVVRVRDTVAPVLALPASAQQIATSAQGAAASYVASASDAVDGAPWVACTPAPGAQLPLGASTVACTATDASGNASQGSFPAQVTVSWSNLLGPIDPLGLTSFLRLLPLSVAFTLTGPSAGITNLPARLLVAPVDAAGNVGSEQRAAGLAPGVGNLFRFVPLAGQYLLSLNTLGMSAGVWQLRVDLGDGVAHTARIRLR